MSLPFWLPGPMFLPGGSISGGGGGVHESFRCQLNPVLNILSSFRTSN